MRNFYNMNRYRFYAGSTAIALELSGDSGQIIYRDKIDTIIGIKHPGIILGTDQFGRTWVAHHHYEHGTPAIETLETFAKGMPVFYDDRPVSYNRATIVSRAFEAWKAGREYHWLMQNCQHFVNKVVNDEHRSDAADELADGAMISGGILALIGAIIGNKGLVTAGLAVTAGGAIGKGLSRMD
jgi:hypothetical protein